MKKVCYLVLFLMCFAVFTLFAGGDKEDVVDTEEVVAAEFDFEWNDIRTFNTLEAAADAGFVVSEFNEDPKFTKMVEEGLLPPVEDRLPVNPQIVAPYRSIGKYGGTVIAGRDSQRHYADAQFFIGYEAPQRVDSDFTTLIPNVFKDIVANDDYSVYTFYLREGMKWSDGEEFNTDDIEFAVRDVLLNKELTIKLNTRWTRGGDDPEFIKVDQYTYQVDFGSPYSYFLTAFYEINFSSYFTSYPEHYGKRFHKDYADPEDLQSLMDEQGVADWVSLFRNNIGGLVAWAGQLMRVWHGEQIPTLLPYVIEEYSDTTVVFTKNPYYWKVDVAGNQLPYIDKVIVSYFNSYEMISGRVLSGDLDAAGFYTDIRDYNTLKSGEEAGDYSVMLWPTPFSAAAYLAPNQTIKGDDYLKQIFQDVRFRRALSLGINRDEINEVIAFGLATPSQNTVLPSSKYYEQEFADAYAQYDVDAANALLDEMGLEWDANHEYRVRGDNGEKISWQCLFVNAEQPKLAIAEIVKDYWKDLGFDMGLRTGDWSFLDNVNRNNELMFGLNHGFSVNDFSDGPLAQQFMIYPSVGWPTTWSHAWNLWYNNAENRNAEEPPEHIKALKELGEEFKRTTTDEENIRIGKEIMRLQAENLWTIGTIAMLPHPVIVSNRVKNVPEKGLWGYSNIWGWPAHPETYYIDE